MIMLTEELTCVKNKMHKNVSNYCTDEREPLRKQEMETRHEESKILWASYKALENIADAKNYKERKKKKESRTRRMMRVRRETTCN